MTSTQTNPPTRNGILMTGLTLLALALATALITACGSSWGEGGDPAEIVAGFAFELELYDVDVYMEQDIPDDLRDSFENTRAEFERYSIDFDDVNNLAKALVDCCTYSNVTQLQGSRVYIVDGTFEPDSVRSALEEELYESSKSGGYEIWESRALTKSFILLDRVAVGFIPDSGYLVIGDIDGVKEVLHMQSGGGSSDDDSAMRQVLSRIGDAWRETGRLDAQTYNTANTHCAPGIRYNQFCQATAYHTSHAGGTLTTVIVSLYASDDQAMSESQNLERNLENTAIYEPIDVEIVDLKVDGQVVEATIEHDNPLIRKLSNLF